MYPSFVNPGEPVKASWANDVVSSIRSNTRGDSNLQNMTKRSPNPFDVIQITYDTTWQLTLQPGFIDGEVVKYSDTNLTDYPLINVVPSKDLFYNWKDKKLVWDNPDEVGNMKILQFTYDEDENFKVRNLHPHNIDTSKYPPFTPLFSKTDSNYFVALTDGYVCGRDVTGVTGGAVTLYKPLSTGNHYPITDGQQASVVCPITKTGLLSANPTIMIEDIDEDSTHFYPTAANIEGEGGTYHYKMCEFSGELKNVLAGSNIDQWVDIPQIDNVDNTDSPGVGRLLKEYSKTLGKYLFRTVVKGLGKNTITTNVDTVEIRGTKKDANVSIWYGDPATRPSPEIEWSDGYMLTGYEIIGDEEFPPDPEEINILIPNVKQLDADPQVHVTNVAVNGGIDYLVRGNSKNGVLTYTVDAESPVTVLEWTDGLVTSLSANIPITGGGSGSGMLSGSYGDMIYHDGTEWVLLENPTAPGEGNEWVLHHDGTAPSYRLYEELTVSICISGVPSSYTILGLINP